MGLDMSLNAEHFIWSSDPAPELDFIPEGYRAQTVVVEAAYWRKANAIHDWFVYHVQGGEDDCNPHYVSTEKLKELVETCKQVIADPTLAEELLPTASGFFFGSTEYDEWYFQSLQRTIDQIEAVLEKFPEQAWTINYQSSW